MTLIELLQNKKVIVPMLQRDYVQGRKKGKSIIGEDFVKAIIDTLATTGKQLHLDFIFGDENPDNELKLNELKLIDGQQRITTLFLVYTYLSHRTGNISNDKNMLQNFSYATRVSSKDFCKDLIEQQINFDTIGTKENSFSNYIKDCSWYSAKWSNDPTINGMLAVLDSIHNNIDKNKLNTMYDNFNQITFENIEMRTHQLDEGTYLRMNGRGKPLDEFEKMKTDIIKAIQENEKYNEPNSTEAILGINNDNNAYKKLTNYISFKLDTDWLEIFWGLDSGDFKKYNEYYRDFLSSIIYVLALKKSNQESTTIEELQVQYDVFDNKENIKFLVESLNTLKEIHDKNKTLLNTIFTFGENGIIRFNNNYNILTQNDKIADKIYLYSILQYLINVNTTLDVNMQDYIRVIRNLLTNSNSYEKIVEIINYINNKNNNENIYKILNNENSQKEFPKFDALLNEIEKAKLIVQAGDVNENNKIREAIHNIEDNEFIRAKTNKILSYLQEKTAEQIQDFSEAFNKIFDVNFLNSYENDIILSRALLACKEYLVRYKWLIVFGSSQAPHDKALSWHQLLTNSNFNEDKLPFTLSLIELCQKFPKDVANTKSFLENLKNITTKSPEEIAKVYNWSTMMILRYGDRLAEIASNLNKQRIYNTIYEEHGRYVLMGSLGWNDFRTSTTFRIEVCSYLLYNLLENNPIKEIFDLAYNTKSSLGREFYDGDYKVKLTRKTSKAEFSLIYSMASASWELYVKNSTTELDTIKDKLQNKLNQQDLTTNNEHKIIFIPTNWKHVIEYGENLVHILASDKFNNFIETITNK